MKEFREDLKRTEKLNTQIIKMVHQDIGSKETLDKFIEETIEKQDQYLTAEECVAMGFIDSIGAIKFETAVNVV